MKKVNNSILILLTVLLLACGGDNGVQEKLTEATISLQCQAATNKQLCLKAAQGDAASQVELGLAYNNIEDYEKAAYWFTKAAKQGDAAGQNNLALFYWNGTGVEQSDEQSVYWFKKAVEQSHAMAQASLGFAYERGRGVSQSDKKAIGLYRESAKQGNVIGATNLAYMYEKGMGVKSSYEKAAYWYEKGAAKNYARAQHNLGELYLFGNGIEKSTEKAIELFKAAAKQGYKTSLLFAELKYDKIAIYKHRLLKDVTLMAQPSYPESAKTEKHQGKVTLKFHLSDTGVISKVVMVKSSGYDELDQAAINALQQLQGLGKPPEGFPSTLTVPIRYKIYRDDVGKVSGNS